MTIDAALALGFTMGFGATQTLWALAAAGERIWWTPVVAGAVAFIVSVALTLVLT